MNKVIQKWLPLGAEKEFFVLKLCWARLGLGFFFAFSGVFYNLVIVDSYLSQLGGLSGVQRKKS